MHLYLGLVAWGVAAFVIYKVINIVLVKRQIAGKSLNERFQLRCSVTG
jgi:hypothetical protein